MSRVITPLRTAPRDLNITDTFSANRACAIFQSVHSSMLGACPAAQPHPLTLSRQRSYAGTPFTNVAQALPALRPFRLQFQRLHCQSSSAHALPSQKRQYKKQTSATYPEPETEKERSPLDYPQVNIQTGTFITWASHQPSYAHCWTASKQLLSSNIERLGIQIRASLCLHHCIQNTLLVSSCNELHYSILVSVQTGLA